MNKNEGYIAILINIIFLASLIMMQVDNDLHWESYDWEKEARQAEYLFSKGADITIYEDGSFSGCFKGAYCDESK